MTSKPPAPWSQYDTYVRVPPYHANDQFKGPSSRQLITRINKFLSQFAHCPDVKEGSLIRVVGQHNSCMCRRTTLSQPSNRRRFTNQDASANARSRSLSPCVLSYRQRVHPSKEWIDPRADHLQGLVHASIFELPFQRLAANRLGQWIDSVQEARCISAT
jgi:hypothetical protein